MLNQTNSQLAKFVLSKPRKTILDFETPLIRLENLSEKLGIELWMKRDDLAGPSFGGNKARQLEYYFGEASAQNADTILITGAVQSNFVRLAAACAVRFGIKPILQLEQRVFKQDNIYNNSGNVLLSNLLGAEVIHYPEGEDEEGADRALYVLAEKLKGEGKNPYVIPLSGNKPPLGALGYYRCAEEITGQQDSAFDYLIVASGSGATHLGLAAGMRLLSPSTKVIGSCVRRNEEMQIKRFGLLCALFNSFSGCPNFLTERDIFLWDKAFEPGYGQIGPLAQNAMKLMAQNEGHLLDPVYTAKSFAAIPGLISDGLIGEGSRVLYVHTGGNAAIFAYQNEMQEIMKK